MAFGSSCFLNRGRLYKTQLGSSIPDLSSKLQRQRNRMPKQYEKFSFQVRTDTNTVSRCKIGYLPILTPRTPIVVEAKETGWDTVRVDQTLSDGAGAHTGILEIHADDLDITFSANAKPGEKSPWKPDCFCPRCGFMREQWVEENRKPFRPFSRQSLLAMNLARERTKPVAQEDVKTRETELQSTHPTTSSDLSS